MTKSFRTNIKLAALTAAGRNPLCSMKQALRGYADSTAQSRAAERLNRECHLLEADAEGFQLWHTPYGAFWTPASTILQGLTMILAEQEAGAYGKVADVVGTRDVVLDCGANIGVFTRHALAAGARMVVSIEPAPENITCLRRNLASELAAGRVQIAETGLWNEETSLPLIIDKHNSGGNSFITRNPDAYESSKIPVTTIDNLVRHLGLERLDFIKMDIEASEQRALDGAQQTLARFRSRMAIAVEHTPDRLANALAVIARARNGCADYHVAGGFCYVAKNNLILPEVLYFS